MVDQTRASCHACGAPIVIGEPVAVYHRACDRAQPEAAGAQAPTQAQVEALREAYIAGYRQAAEDQAPAHPTYRPKARADAFLALYAAQEPGA